MTKLSANHLKWIVRRERRNFAIQIVEPKAYDPPSHGSIFEQVLGNLLMPAVEPVDGDFSAGIKAPTPFDLLTFPEAFAPVDALLGVLPIIQQIETFGCIHVGLRPSTEAKHHLFAKTDIDTLLSGLRNLPGTVGSDFQSFETWFARQSANLHFNLGCLFTVDIDGSLRICLHPKLVRSKFEYSPLKEDHLEEADLVTLVTLIPDDNRFRSVTIQPLICSDALNLPTDRGTPPPIKAVNAGENPFSEPPDHIDLVSIATCTPQVERASSDGMARKIEWHQAFRDTFCSAADDGDHPRHHFATFVLSNFELIHSRSGGLSGLFQPIDPPNKIFHEAIELSCFGRHPKGQGNNSWWPPGQADAKDWDWRGYIGSLKPSTTGDTAAVRIFGFTLTNLLRDASLWSPPRGPSKCEVVLGRWGADNCLGFGNWEERRDV